MDEYGEVEIYHTDIVLTVRSLLLFGGGSDAGGGWETSSVQFQATVGEEKMHCTSPIIFMRVMKFVSTAL